MFPKKYPISVKPTTHNTAPITLYVMKIEYPIRPIPATKGANVLTIGTKRAITIVLEPYLVKKSSVFWIAESLIIRLPKILAVTNLVPKVFPIV